MTAFPTLCLPNHAISLRRSCTGVGQGPFQKNPGKAATTLVLGNIDTDDNEIVLCHHPIPFLARSGLEAHATVRVEEDTGSVPRSPSGSRGLTHETGSDPATGGFTRAARSHILADFADTRARRKPLKPLRAGMPGEPVYPW